MPNWFAEPPRAWLVASALDLEDQGEQKGTGESASLRALGGRTNRVQLGVPQAIDVLATWPSTERLEAEIAAARHRFDFYSVRIACSFIPDRGCHFVSARLGITLSEARTEDVDAPIALDLFPREVSVKRAFSRSYGLKGGLKFSFLEVSADVRQEEEAIRYEPALTGAGLLTDSPSWMFDATGSTGLAGISELFLLIKKSKGRGLTAQFALGAELQTAWGLRRYSKERLLEAAYPLKA
jgi:hypothetical protein